MKSKTKAIVLLVFLLVISTVAVACGNAGDSSEPTPTQTEETNTEGEGTGETDSTVSIPYDPPVTITTVRGLSSNVEFKNGETIDDNVHTRWAKERLGIEIKNNWTVQDVNNAFATKLRLSLSSNEKMPDVLVVDSGGTENKILINDLIESGQFQDAGSLFDKYASETYKSAMNVNPTVWYPFTQDGKRMAIPVLNYSGDSNNVLYIREDWMKKLKLKAPTTIEDLETIMEAFANQDPDGNGKKDTIPLSTGFSGSFVGSMAGVQWLFGAYGTLPAQWNKAEDGTLEYGSIHPGNKPALAKLKEWMNKGYISKDSGLYDSGKASELFLAGTSGIISTPYWYGIHVIMNTLEENVPTAEWKAYPIPVNSEGKGMRNDSHPQNKAILINKDMVNVEAFFTYMNYIYDNAFKEGTDLEHGFAEGYDWAQVNGEVVYDAPSIPGGGVLASSYTLLGGQFRSPSEQFDAMAKISSGQEPSIPFERFVAKSVAPAAIDAGKTMLEQKGVSFANLFMSAPTKTMLEQNAFLAKQELEMFSQIIYGEVPLDDFDNFVASWKSDGGDQITKEVNEWYNSVKSN